MEMKNQLNSIACMAMMALAFTACQQSASTLEGTCTIKGSIPEAWNGKKIFLVPMNGPQDSLHVDSVVIENGQFEFTKDTCQLEVIRVDYHFRQGAQDLLIVTEPGTLQVNIGANSTAFGTPQNDSLQAWKELTEQQNQDAAPYRIQLRDAAKAGDAQAKADAEAKLKDLRRAYKQRTRQMAANLPEGDLKEFLGKMFPTHYKKRMPDGTVKEVQAED
jgi:hypothetical protein